MNKKTKLAWEQCVCLRALSTIGALADHLLVLARYLKMETSNESFTLLQLIANDCYKVCCGSVVLPAARGALVTQRPLLCTLQMGAFFYAAKAFDVLERLDPDPEYWEGKRGACVGVLQQVIAGAEPKEHLREVLNMLRNTSNPQVEYIVRTIQKWCMQNGVAV